MDTNPACFTNTKPSRSSQGGGARFSSPAPSAAAAAATRDRSALGRA